MILEYVDRYITGYEISPCYDANNLQSNKQNSFFNPLKPLVLHFISRTRTCLLNYFQTVTQNVRDESSVK